MFDSQLTPIYVRRRKIPFNNLERMLNSLFIQNMVGLLDVPNYIKQFDILLMMSGWNESLLIDHLEW